MMERFRRSRASGGPLSPAILAVLRQCRWVHALNMASDCEGCANDGEEGYCEGADIGQYQDSDTELYCHCGHTVVMVEVPLECQCSGPEGWHCPGEESQHWTTDEDPNGECGHCGERPSGYDPSLEPAAIVPDW